MAIEFARLPVKDQLRIHDVQTIRHDTAEIIASASAYLNLQLGTPLKDVLKVKDSILNGYNSQKRSRVIQLALDTQELFKNIMPKVCPSCEESNLAFQTKRLDVLSKMIKAGIAEGKVAVSATNFLFGKEDLGIANMDIVKEESFGIKLRNIFKSQL